MNNANQGILGSWKKTSIRERHELQKKKKCIVKKCLPCIFFEKEKWLSLPRVLGYVHIQELELRPIWMCTML